MEHDTAAELRTKARELRAKARDLRTKADELRAKADGLESKADGFWTQSRRAEPKTASERQRSRGKDDCDYRI